MFDEYAQRLLDNLPNLPNLAAGECRRMLSSAYAKVIEGRLEVEGEGLSNEKGEAVVEYLRRLADALESVAIFDPLNGVDISHSTISASAFAAAEGLALLALLPDPEKASLQVDAEDLLKNRQVYALIEAGLLYLVAGYDVNAVSVVQDIPSYSPARADTLFQAAACNSSYLISRIRALCRGDAAAPTYPIPFRGYDKQPTLYEDILLENRLRCSALLAEAVNEYLDWLAGGSSELFEHGLSVIRRVIDATRVEAHSGYAAMADIHHLASLLYSGICRTSERSVTHNVPAPQTGDANFIASFQTYLQKRAKGDNTSIGRPFLWPSTTSFISNCLPGPKCDSVVAMPTGSGKSFVAELATIDALSRGGVIYLAPTNALVHQIRRDLRSALAPFPDVEIVAFVGGGEYSAGLDGFVQPSQNRFVAVMTPEKCSLALRLSPDSFADLALCVFDECHLLNDRNRGVTADILLAQLFTAAPQMRFVLMSAMVSNPEDLANWLAEARNSTGNVSVIKWRPSRTLRGLIGVDLNTTQHEWDAAIETLLTIKKVQPHRVRQKFNASTMLLSGLSGPWNTPDVLDYRVAQLPLTFEAGVEIRKGSSPTQDFGGWTNITARQVGTASARDGIPVIVFVLRSRHHAFSMADQVEEAIPGSLEEGEEFDPLVEACLQISEIELGCPTILRSLLHKGIAVHTSAMLSTEQAASEWMFVNQRAKLMFATPTLAQGLNLPAIGVVVAGTSVGGGRNSNEELDDLPGLNSRADATILNSFGRAGQVSRIKVLPSWLVINRWASRTLGRLMK